jgi:hypothetical protein
MMRSTKLITHTLEKFVILSVQHDADEMLIHESHRIPLNKLNNFQFFTT